MRYVEPIFRPGPSEGNSYLLQVTYGCSHNKCTFCSFYKQKPFRIRPLVEIFEDLEMARKYFPLDPPVFLIDGEATCYTMDKLRPILQKIRETFPNSPHTNMYGRYSDIYRHYTVENLKEMKELNVKFLYLGMESGSDKVLADINKGTNQEEIIEASRKLHEAGMAFSTTVILGMGAIKDSEEHIRESIRIINETKPTSVGTTVINPQTGTPLYEDVLAGKFELPTYKDVLREERMLIEGIVTDNEQPIEIYTGGFLPGNEVVTGTLPMDKDTILNAIGSRRITKIFENQKLMVNGGL